MVYLLRYRGLAYSFKPVVATGGIITNGLVDGILYRYHTFVNVGGSSFTVTDSGSDRVVEYFVVGGGGGGGWGGGGGVGGARLGTRSVSIRNYSVVVGGGGNGAGGRDYFSTAPTPEATSGSPSSFDSLASSGGVRGRRDVGGPSGNGFLAGSAPCGGGGGGSAANGSGYTGGNGIFLPDWASGTSTGVNGYYSGGGGGSAQRCSRSFGNGGLGGGGRGARGSGGDEDRRQDSPSPGVPRTGSGGGAGHRGVENFVRAGARGGSGIVIVRYPLAVIPN